MCKRIVSVVCFFVAISAFVHGEFNFSGWGRGVITPYASEGDYSGVSSATTTSGEQPNIGFTVKGVSGSGNIGFTADTAWDGGLPKVGDNAKVWITPFSMLKLTAGFFKEDDFRGKIGGSEFGSWLLPNGGSDEDKIFTRFDAATGAHIKFEPLWWLASDWNGLAIEAALGSTAGNKRIFKNLVNDWDADNPKSIADVYKAIHIGLGYKIPQIGFFRMQFIGNTRQELRKSIQTNIMEGTTLVEGLNKSSDADVLEMAFQLTLVEGLDFDLGAKIPFAYETDTEFQIYPGVVYKNESDVLTYKPEKLNIKGKMMNVQRPFVVALGAVWTPSFLDGLRVMARGDISLGGTLEDPDPSVFRLKYGAVINAYLVPSYRVLPNFTVGLDFGVQVHTGDTWIEDEEFINEKLVEVSKYTDIGFGPWVELDVGGGRIKTGIMFMMPGSARYQYDAGNTQNKISAIYTGDPVITIPISFTYSF
jgi:hypothetical protein